jgi:hypothetical protein
MSEQLAVVLRVDDDLLAPHPSVFGIDPHTRCLSLVAAISASPAWGRLRDRARLAVRPDQGLIGLFGSFQPEDRPALAALGWQTAGLLRRLRPVSYDDVAEACLDLAGQLQTVVASLGGNAYRMEPIPRGGHIVTGLLAYALGGVSDGGREPKADPVTILVDDCALSGTRLRQQIAAHPGRTLVVALLHAHPDLMRHVREAEGSVRATLAARDLVDHAPERPDYVDWHARWSVRTPDDYWTGDPDHVCYPWNEPDALIWNYVTKTAETAWRVVPPSWCLKNRVDGHVEDIQRCEPAAGDLQPTAQVIWANTGDGVLAVADGSDEVVLLRGDVAAAWEAIVRTGTRVAALQALAGDDTVPGRAQRLDLIVNSLVARSLLEAPVSG